MKIHKGVVHSEVDPGKNATLKVSIEDSALPGVPTPIDVTQMAPISNSNAGDFSMPTPGSEVLVLEIEYNDNPGGTAIGYYNLGCLVGARSLLGMGVDEDKLESNEECVPEGVPDGPPYLDEGTTIDETSLGREDKNSLSVSPEAAKSYKANEFIPQRRTWEDVAGNAMVFSHEQRMGNPTEQYANPSLTLQTGRGKKVVMSDATQNNMMQILNGDELNDVITFAGKTSDDSQYTTGEFSVNTNGSVNLQSRSNYINFEIIDGYNINIINESTGDKDGNLGFAGQGTWVEHQLINSGGADANPTKENEEGTPRNSSYNKYNHPGSTVGQHGNPLEKGDQETGCINIISAHNNINIEAEYDDSVIYINAPGYNSKVVVNTGGTVDILAKKKVTITSDEKIELNAPYIDLNSEERIDLD